MRHFQKKNKRRVFIPKKNRHRDCGFKLGQLISPKEYGYLQKIKNSCRNDIVPVDRTQLSNLPSDARRPFADAQGVYAVRHSNSN